MVKYHDTANRSERLARCLAVTLEFEGGYVDHPSDPGGATNMGITRAVLANWRGVSPVTALPKSEVKNLARDEAESIYAAKYWAPLRGDDLPIGVDLVTLDSGVNSGVGHGAKWLQFAVGADQDGKVGRETLKAVSAAPVPDTIKKVCAKRLSFVQSLKIWNTFGKGWSRRIAKVEATALSWVLTPAEVKAEAEAAEAKAKTQTNAGAATGASGGGAILIDQGAHLSGWLLVGTVVAFIAIAAILVSRSVINRQRAQALTAIAESAK